MSTNVTHLPAAPAAPEAVGDVDKAARVGASYTATIEYRDSLAPAPSAEPVGRETDWRELCRRLYVELHWCNQQMTGGLRPKWKIGQSVREALDDAKAALATPPASEDVIGPTDAECIEWIESALCDGDVLFRPRSLGGLILRTPDRTVYCDTSVRDAIAGALGRKAR